MASVESILEALLDAYGVVVINSDGVAYKITAEGLSAKGETLAEAILNAEKETTR